VSRSMRLCQSFLKIFGQGDAACGSGRGVVLSNPKIIATNSVNGLMLTAMSSTLQLRACKQNNLGGSTSFGREILALPTLVNHTPALRRPRAFFGRRDGNDHRIRRKPPFSSQKLGRSRDAEITTKGARLYRYLCSKQSVVLEVFQNSLYS
jgi:hypothetical protein